MLENLSIVVFSNDWEGDPTSKHHVMRLLSGKNKVLWINSIGMRRPGISRSDFSRIVTKVRSWFRGAKKVNDNMYHLTPFVLPFPGSKLCRVVNRILLTISIKYYRKKFHMGEVQLWTFLPNIVEMIGRLHESKLVYYCVDEWSKFSFMDGELLRSMEIQLMEKADLVLTTADCLYQDKVRFNANTHLLTHGVDYRFFSKALDESTIANPELSGLKGPIIGFFGLIHEWIDIELIEAIARAHPEWNVVLIGTVRADVENLRILPNVFLLGKKPYAELPGYCKRFDIGLVPFRINELTVNVNPIKLREYLAAGLPVVSTPLPECQKYSDVIGIGGTPEELAGLIEKALAEDSPEARKARSDSMQEETWERKVEELSELVMKA